jgi:glycosyltransferase involved in cell wall biosynthesis
MQKIACLFSFKMSSWVSCQKIVFNLHKAYELNPNVALTNFNYSSSQTYDEIVQTAKSIVSLKPDIITILDHKPHPLAILQVIKFELVKRKLKPKFIFHIFGDFTLYYPEWDKLSKILEDYSVEFVVASDRQKILIDKFLTPTLKAHVCPFPVDDKEFFYDPDLRENQRKEWNLVEDDLALVFTGRLSRQKRIHTMLEAFSDFLISTKTKKVHLFLYGTTDHVGDQFLGLWETEGEYFRKISRVYKSLPLQVQKKIHFMGSVPNRDLRSVYQGADYLLNLSVHNDEDYGMSVAEALCSGLPAILTDWGGLASFELKTIPEATQFIPVRIGKASKIIHYDYVVETLCKILKTGPSKKRSEISQEALGRFSVRPACEIIQNVVNFSPEPFTKFGPLFEKILTAINFTSTPYITQRKNINELYREIYSSYVRDH